MNSYKYDAARLQENLKHLRYCAGISLEELGDAIGQAPSAVKALEGGSESKLITKLQYIGIRKYFEELIRKNPGNINLRDCYDLIFAEKEFQTESNHEALIVYAISLITSDVKTCIEQANKTAKRAGFGTKEIKRESVTALVGGSLAVLAGAIAIGGPLGALEASLIGATGAKTAKLLIPRKTVSEAQDTSSEQEKDKQIVKKLLVYRSSTKVRAQGGIAAAVFPQYFSPITDPANAEDSEKVHRASFDANSQWLVNALGEDIARKAYEKKESQSAYKEGE